MPYARYIPPLNYGMVEDDLYRSGQPNELNFPFLEKLQLRTVLFLAPEEPNQKFLEFMEDQEIRWHHLPVASTELISEEVVLEALRCILDPSNYPLMVMCNLGRHRTGTIVGCLRKLQQWSLTSIFEEYRRFAGTKVRILNEQFIELFDVDLVRVPANCTILPQSTLASPTALDLTLLPTDNSSLVPGNSSATGNSTSSQSVDAAHSANK